jgi:dipeptidyl aminopeptidase/acylaminoacyl peptidase
VELRRVAAYPKVRVLTWAGEYLYACRGYSVVRLRAGSFEWEAVAQFRPVWWRSLTAQNTLAHRLVRDGFHALVVLDDGTMIGAVPGAIVTRTPGDNEFRLTHRIVRGTRPLHITATPSGRVYWGEYFDNRERSEVHIYISEDRGSSWQVAYTFPARSIRHVHNLICDRWADCLWILTGDEGAECRVLRASYDLGTIDAVITGNQQARAVAAVPTQDALYLSTDTPYEQNHVYRLDRAGQLEGGRCAVLLHDGGAERGPHRRRSTDRRGAEGR